MHTYLPLIVVTPRPNGPVVSDNHAVKGPNRQVDNPDVHQGIHKHWFSHVLVRPVTQSVVVPFSPVENFNCS